MHVAWPTLGWYVPPPGARKISWTSILKCGSKRAAK